jgi:hypothetical protein
MTTRPDLTLGLGITPPPWVVSGLPKDYDEAVNGNGPVCVARLPREGMAHYRYQRGELDANAKLIAAAPMLLAAAYVGMEAIEYLLTQVHPSSDDAPQLREDLDQIRAALLSAGLDPDVGRCGVCHTPDVKRTMRDDGVWICGSCEADNT